MFDTDSAVPDERTTTMPEGARNLKLTIAVSVASVLVVASALVILSDGRANSLLSESYTPTELAAIEGYTNASTLCVYNKASVLMKVRCR